MTFEDYMTWKSAMQSHIAKRLAESELRAGRGVNIQGRTITVEKPPPKQAPRPDAENWALHLFAETKGTLNGSGFNHCGYVANGGSNIFLGNYYWETTQLYDIPEGPPTFDPPMAGSPAQYEAKSIRFWARAIYGYRLRTSPPERLFEASHYRIPIKLTLEQYDAENPGEKVVAVHTLELRRNGQEKLFRPTQSEQTQLLRLKSIELL